MKFPILICNNDDEVLLTTALEKVEHELSCMRPRIDFEISYAANYEEALKYLHNHKPNRGVYFLEVDLGEGLEHHNGIDLGEIIRKQDKNGELIYFSHANLAFQTYQRRLDARDYILKSFDIDEIERHLFNSTMKAVNQIYEDRIVNKE